MSKYEGYENINNNEVSDVKPKSSDTFDWPGNTCDLKKDVNKKIKYEDEVPIKHTLSRKTIIISSVTVGVLLIAIAIVVTIFLAGYIRNESYSDDYTNDYDAHYSETIEVNNEVSETELDIIGTETVVITTDKTNQTVSNNSMTEKTNVNSSDSVILTWPATDIEAYDLLEKDFNLNIVYVYSSSTPLSYVYDMNPSAGSVLKRGSNVTLYVSFGDGQDAWSEWTEDNVEIDSDFEYEYKDQCRYRRVCEFFENVDDMLVYQYSIYDEWSDWIDLNGLDDLDEDFWWADGNSEYYEYSEYEYRTVCRYRIDLPTVD